MGSSTMTGLSCWGSPTSIRLLPRKIGTSDIAVLHWLASSMITISKTGSGLPSRWAEMQVVAMMGNTRSSFFRFSGSGQIFVETPPPFPGVPLRR